MKSNSTGQGDVAGEVAHEHERPLQHPDEQRRAPLVVLGDLGPQLGHPRRQLVGGHHDPPEMRVLDPHHGSVVVTSRGVAHRRGISRVQAQAPSVRSTRQPPWTSAARARGGPRRAPGRRRRRRRGGRRPSPARARPARPGGPGPARRPAAPGCRWDRGRRPGGRAARSPRPGSRPARARTGTTVAPATSSSNGSTSWRTRVRRWVGSSLVGSTSGSRPSAPQRAAVSVRRRSSSGRRWLRRMPARPGRPAPRRRFRSMVSAWSSAVWPVSTSAGRTP